MRLHRKSTRVKRRTSRDLSRAELKKLINRADQSEPDWDAVEVLGDVLLQKQGATDLGEKIRAFVHARSKGELTGGSGIMRRILSDVRFRLFPPRKAPCLPNRKNLSQLVSDPNDQRRLLSALREACEHRRGRFPIKVDHALDLANEITGGYGIESLRAPNEQFGTYYFDIAALYVNQGDPYVATLIYVVPTDRFYITGWGDIATMLERKYGELR